MTVYSMQGEYLSEVTYLVAEGGKALIVDPGASAQRILSECAKLGLEPVAVLLTHGHADHTAGAIGLQEKGVKVYAHREEVSVLERKANLALAFRLIDHIVRPDVTVEDGDCLEIAPFCVKVIFTPGHTQGGVCYLVGDCLFTGDTLFPGSYGRTDLPTGDEQDLLCSIANELFELPPETKVYSGHGEASLDARPCGPQTTIGEERSTNPILYLL